VVCFIELPASSILVANEIWISALVLTCYETNSFVAKVGRKRVFILCARDKFRFPDHHVCSLMSLQFARSSFSGGLAGFFVLQDDFDATGEVDMHKPWNDLNAVPLAEWLNESQTEQDQCRLRCMGNIVVPLQACQASRTLARMEPVIR